MSFLIAYFALSCCWASLLYICAYTDAKQMEINLAKKYICEIHTKQNLVIISSFLILIYTPLSSKLYTLYECQNGTIMNDPLKGR